jgi:hypothetical protein
VGPIGQREGERKGLARAGAKERKWASVAHAGEGEEERGEGCWASGGPCGREEGKRELGWAKGLGCSLSFFFSSSFLYTNIQTKLFEFK